MKPLDRRLAALEQRTHKPARAAWQTPTVERRAGQDLDAQLAALRGQALAAGWRPEQGPYVIEVLEPDEPTTTPT